MIDLALLHPRVAAATQLAPDQLLIGDLWIALQEVEAALAAAQNLIATLSADPAAVANLQQQVRDVTAQRDDALTRLGAAQLALTADQQTLADLKLADQQLIASLNATIDKLKVSLGGLQQQLGAAAQAHAVDLTTIASQQQQLSVTQGQLSTAVGQLTKLQADLATAQAALTAANAEVVRLGGVVKAQADQITLLQQQLANQAPPNRAPVWNPAMPLTFTFVFGVPQTIDFGQYVSDPDGDRLLPLRKNSIAWPPGITFDPVTMKASYDGKGGLSNTIGHMLTADDGRG